MVTLYAIVDRDTGEFFGRGSPKVYNTESIARRVFTQQSYWAPTFSYAVVEIEVTITGVIDKHKMDKVAFNDLLKLEEDRLDNGYGRPEEIDRLKRFRGRYNEIKYI